jgi:hypothetical protein
MRGRSFHSARHDIPPAQHDTAWVAATDIAHYVYCGRSYWLTRVRHVSPNAAAQARLAAGTRAHQQAGADAQHDLRTDLGLPSWAWGRRVYPRRRRATVRGCLIRLGALLLIAGLAIALLYALTGLRR